MASQYPYRQTIQNEYLAKSKVIRAMTIDDLQWMIRTQLEKWDDEEDRKRRKDHEKQVASDLKGQAEQKTTDLRDCIAELRAILGATLQIDDTIRWEALLDNRKFPEFKFDQPKPDRESIRSNIMGPAPTEESVRQRLNVPRARPIIEFVLPFLTTHREEAERLAKAAYQNEMRAYREREKEAVNVYNEQVRQYNELLRTEKLRHGRARDDFAAKQRAHNDEVLSFRKKYESGVPAGIEQYCQTVLQNSAYPAGIDGDADTMFEASSKTLVVNFWLPSPRDVPNVAEYRFVASTKSIKEIAMKKDEHQGRASAHFGAVWQAGLSGARCKVVI